MPPFARRPRLVAITGGSGAGKSWLADRLQWHLGGQTVARLSLDEFYRDRSHVPPVRRPTINFDHPRAIDWRWVERVLNDFSKARPSPLPCYDFVEHVRTCSVRWLQPAPVLVMDGLWLLRRPSVRSFFEHRIFIECPADIRLRRRIDRDVAERGRDAGLAQLQFKATVAPMHERFVAGQRRWASLILAHPPNEADAGQLAAMLSRGKKTMNGERFHGSELRNGTPCSK